jgi:hypothetical protein
MIQGAVAFALAAREARLEHPGLQARGSRVLAVHKGANGIAGFTQFSDDEASGLSCGARHDDPGLGHVRLLRRLIAMQWHVFGTCRYHSADRVVLFGTHVKWGVHGDEIDVETPPRRPR